MTRRSFLTSLAAALALGPALLEWRVRPNVGYFDMPNGGWARGMAESMDTTCTMSELNPVTGRMIETWQLTNGRWIDLREDPKCPTSQA